MIAAPGTPAPCTICGAARSRHDAVKGPACSSLGCQTEALRIKQREENEAFDRKCDEFAVSFGESHGTQDHITARVPFLERPVVETPDERKQVFRKTLREALRETFDNARDGSLAPVHPYMDEPFKPVLDASCIACRGFCCRQGAGHAYLNRYNLPSILNRRPKDAPATVYRDYVERIPDEALEDSCIFHGARGCALPRDMRSEICNDYECSGRQTLKEALKGRDTASSVVVAMERDTIKSAAIAAPAAPLSWLDVPDQD